MICLGTMARRHAVRSVQVAAGIIGLIGSGCGGAPPPDQRLTESQAAVRAAQEVGAETVPQSALHLKLAQEQVDKSKRLMNDGDNEEADLVLQRAQADAELAIALAKEETTRQQAKQVLEKAAAAGVTVPANTVKPMP
jgi:pyridoxal biosynthesis lyase PdxS